MHINIWPSFSLNAVRHLLTNALQPTSIEWFYAIRTKLLVFPFAILLNGLSMADIHNVPFCLLYKRNVYLSTEVDGSFSEP